MRPGLGAANLVALALLLPSSYALAQEPAVCDEAPTVSDASAAFDAFCGGCHRASRLAKSYFADTDAKDMDRREAELATFLDRHSGCPHRHHEDISAWLRSLATLK